MKNRHIWHWFRLCFSEYHFQFYSFQIHRNERKQFDTQIQKGTKQHRGANIRFFYLSQCTYGSQMFGRRWSSSSVEHRLSIWTRRTWKSTLNIQPFEWWLRTTHLSGSIRCTSLSAEYFYLWLWPRFCRGSHKSVSSVSHLLRPPAKSSSHFCHLFKNYFLFWLERLKSPVEYRLASE